MVELTIYSLTDRGAAVRTQFVLHTVLILVSTILVGLRLLSRHLKRVGFWWDDWALVVGLALDFILYGIGVAFLRYGVHTHVEYVSEANMTVVLKLLVAYQVIYCTTLLFVKASWCFFYLRVFVNKTFRLWVWGTLVFCLVLWAAFMLQTFLICAPFEKNWYPWVPGHCGNEPLGFIVVGILVILTDIWIVCLPLPVIWKLQLEPRTKWSLYAVFGLGLFITIASCVREKVISSAFNDIAWDLFTTVYWTFIEPTVAIITACLPMVRLVVLSLLPAGHRRRARSSSAHISPRDSNSQAFKRIEEGRGGECELAPVSVSNGTVTTTCTAGCFSEEGYSDGSSKGRDSFIPSSYYPPEPDEGEGPEKEQAGTHHPGRYSYIK